MAAGRNAMRRDAPARTWARLTLAGAVAYLIMDVISQALPPHYGPIRQAKSDLGVGPFGWVMDANFILRGLLTGCALLALRRGMPRSAGGTAGLALVAFVCAAAGILALSRAAPFPGALPAAWAAVVALILLVPAQRAEAGGLVERVFLLLVLLWLVLAARAATRGP